VKILTDVVFLAADTERSNAYAQAMAQNKLKVAHTILFGDGQITSKPVSGWLDASSSYEQCGVWLPDLAQPVAKSLEDISVDMEKVDAKDINDQSVINAVMQALGTQIKLVIYSGFGGQIVGCEHLSLDVPYIHAHSGWLPEYRGSTTIYYSLVNNTRCGVSVIQLASGLDRGKIVSRKWYPAPPPNIDIDFIYDSAIRADLIAETLKRWGNGKDVFAEAIQNPEAQGADYFVIHPVLKHLAVYATQTINGRR
jgi:methionyl-tRNA formyltransferase